MIATLELADHEVRLVVGQFFNGRLNVLKVERVPHYGIKNFRISDASSVKQAIRKSVENASKNIGGEITQVLMCVPSVGLVKTNEVQTLSINGTITKTNLIQINENFLNTAAPKDKILVNTLIKRYHVNGLPTRKVPLNERCNSLTVEADCYFCDKITLFEYLRVVEDSGIKVIDIVSDDIGFAKEASLLEASINQPIIGVTLERTYSKLTLYHQGQILSNIIRDKGMSDVFDVVKDTYNFGNDIAERLIYYNLDISDVSPSLNPIFAWTTKTDDYTLSRKDILDLAGPGVIKVLDDLHKTSEPIYELGTPRYVLSGEASIISGLTEILTTISQTEVSTYQPTTFGVKNPVFTSLVGALYFYKDTEVYREENKTSIDEQEFYRNTIYRDTKESAEKQGTTSLTQKLKDLFVE